MEVTAFSLNGSHCLTETEICKLEKFYWEFACIKIGIGCIKKK